MTVKNSAPTLSGFTIIRNGVEFDFPFLESFTSALSIVDEFIINIGESSDDTKEKIQKWISALSKVDAKKIITFDSHWPLDNLELKKGGKILSQQTNLALEKCKSRWCLYLQADEVLHEEDHDEIKKQLEAAEKNNNVEALVFQYIHFYGNYNVVQTSRSSYRREIRIIRNGLGIQSTGDAQSFRHRDGKKLNAVLTKARIFHYGWVRPQEKMKEKTVFMDSLYRNEVGDGGTGTNYIYKRIIGLRPFLASHPEVMLDRVRHAPEFDFKKAPKVFHLQDTWKVVSAIFEKFTGYRPFEFKNYKLIK